MKLIIAILLTTLTACGQSNKSTFNKTEIQLSNVQKIEIRLNYNDSTFISLTDIQAQEFVTKWNNSKSEGPCKYMPKLWIAVSMKNGITRTFRANRENIKEDNDWCYSIGDIDFFDHLWTDNKK